VSTPDQIEVEQGTMVSPGAILDINLVGGTCPGPSSPDISLYSSAGVPVASAPAPTVGGWTHALALPSSVTPGAYRLEADCTYSRGAVYGTYEPATIIVR
jgi:hypothetical protein